jgi:hypothetical protein
LGGGGTAFGGADGGMPNCAAAGAAHRIRTGKLKPGPRRNLAITVPIMAPRILAPKLLAPKLAGRDGSAGMVTKV